MNIKMNMKMNMNMNIKMNIIMNNPNLFRSVVVLLSFWLGLGFWLGCAIMNKPDLRSLVVLWFG